MEQRPQCQKRLTQELKLIATDPPDGITAGPSDDDMLLWSASITGPPGSPYAGGIFFLEIEIPPHYPAKPPSIKFKTTVYHPNISSVDGSVFIDVLGEKWCPALTLPTILLSVQSLLTDPNPEDPCEPDIAREYVDDKETFDKTAEEWTVMYAMG